MKAIHNLIPGTPEWHLFRLQHGGASEAAAMLGMDPNMKRSELLRMKHTGLEREFSEWLQSHVLDKGHEVEALALPRAEAFIGEDLYPSVYSDGYPSASTDGIVLDESKGWECKQWSEERAAPMRERRMPEKDMPQVQQQMMVTGATDWLFEVTDGTPERTLRLWVKADPEWHQRLRDGWAQFQRDLAAFTLPPATEPAPVGKAPDTLPALRIEITGAVTASNLAEFKQTALAAICGVNRTLKTDADFADAEKAVKWCADVESRLKAAKEHALSQTASIDALFKALDDIAAESKAVRLDLGKVIDRRKIERKEEAVTAARRELDNHIAALNGKLAPMHLLPHHIDFAGAIKGLRSFASMDDALSTAVASAKIVADAQARCIRANVAAFDALALADNYGFLFADLHLLVHKAADDFGAVVRLRIATHKAAEAKKEAERAAAEAQRIAQAEQRAREQEAARIAAEQEAQRRHDAAEQALLARAAQQAAATTTAADPAPSVILIRGDAVTPVNDTGSAEPATLNLGTINARFGGRVAFTAAGLALMGIEHSATDKAAKLYRESDIGRICRALVALAGEVVTLQAV